MAVLAIEDIVRAGVQPTYAAADVAGDTFANDGRTMLHAKNGSGGPLDVTVESQANCDQGFEHDATVSIPAGEERMIGPFDAKRFGNPATLTYPGGVTSLTIRAFRLSGT